MIGTPGYTLFISTENKSSRGELEFDTGLGICWLSALHNYFIPKMMLKRRVRVGRLTEFIEKETIIRSERMINSLLPFSFYPAENHNLIWVKFYLDERRKEKNAVVPT